MLKRSKVINKIKKVFTTDEGFVAKYPHQLAENLVTAILGTTQQWEPESIDDVTDVNFTAPCGSDGPLVTFKDGYVVNFNDLDKDLRAKLVEKSLGITVPKGE